MGPPRPVTAAVTATVAALVLAAATWLAGAPRAEQAQTDFITAFNDPHQPLAAILAVTNPLLRPWPLAILGVAFIGWVLITASDAAQRWETLRAALLAGVAAELVAQVFKRLTNQPRPLVVLPGLDSHGYPKTPHGSSFPSAHTAICFAILFAMWPWLRWPQRLVGALFAVLVGLNRMYVAAHWPIDVVGGVAIGALSGSVAWLVADQWPIVRSVRSQ
jgi:membrane-associated phospholipid phosphatase